MSTGQADRYTALDGVRGIAIALVMYHHFVIYSGFSSDAWLDSHVLRTGKSTWLGVDLFFVLSGFLITGILYEAKATAHYFRNFYARRTLRIFPLYYAFLAGGFLVLPLFLHPSARDALTAGQEWYWLYLSNVDVALHGWREPLHFGHFWSLAVEEQFYLVWPLVVYAFGRTRLLQITVACFAAALLLRFVLPQWLDPLANYVLMPTRMDAFAAGAFVALVHRSPGGLRSLGHWPLLTLILSLVAGAFTYKVRYGLSEMDPWLYKPGFSVIAVACASFIALAMTSSPSSVLGRILTNRLLTTLGKYAYALYVFHQPVVLVMRDWGFTADIVPRVAGSQLPGLLLFSSVAFVVCFAAALLSWRVLEEPCLRLKRYFVPARPVSSEKSFA